MGIFLSIPIAFIYNWLVSKISDMITKDDVMKDKVHKNLIISMVAGIVALIIGFIIFGSKRFENNIAKYGFILGGVILLVYSLVCNWDQVEDQTKLFLIGGILLTIILYSYKSISKKEKNNADK